MIIKPELLHCRMTAVILLIIISLTSAVALQCSYDSKPYLNNIPFKEEKIFWSCDVDDTHNYTCFTYVNNSDTNEFIQINPEPSVYKGIGIDNQFFRNNHNLLSVYFTNKNLLAGGDYIFGVTCLDEVGAITNQENNVVPVLRDLKLDRFVWLQSQWGYIIGLTLIAMLISLMLYMIFKK